MSEARHVPVRQCAGCGRSDAQARLARFGLRDGRVTWDPSRRLSGRGAYLHLEGECLERFMRRKPSLRSLRVAISREERCRLVSEAKGS